MVQAHEFFAKRAREWLAADMEIVQPRAAAIERTVRELMQIVVIDLAADENAQEIFETLNARGVFGPFTWAPVLNNIVAIGGLIAGSCIFEFAWRGIGTPAPFDVTINLR